MNEWKLKLIIKILPVWKLLKNWKSARSKIYIEKQTQKPSGFLGKRICLYIIWKVEINSNMILF